MIEGIVPVLENAALSLIRQQELDEDIFPEIVDFLRVFADECHHGLEESHFFPAMGEAGIDTESGLVRDLKEEHKAMRRLVRKIAELWEDFSYACAARTAEDIHAAVQVFVRVLPAHIRKEDDTCFPMADEALSAEQQARLAAQYQEIQSRELCSGVIVHYGDVLTRLQARLRGGS